jgi:hypothetical protein
MSNEEDPDESPQLSININIAKFNSYTVIAAVLLSIIKNNNDYINAVYDSLVLIIIYTNLLFIYIFYVNRHRL